MRRRHCKLLAALTSLLADIADSAAPTALVFDDCEWVDASAVLEILDYLLHNLPPNLQIAVGSRTTLPLQTAELIAHGSLRRVVAAELRFDPAETLHLLNPAATRGSACQATSARFRLQSARILAPRAERLSV